MRKSEVRYSIHIVKKIREAAPFGLASLILFSVFLTVTPNAARIPYRRVGCAHQTSLISSVKGGQSPPYANNSGINHR